MSLKAGCSPNLHPTAATSGSPPRRAQDSSLLSSSVSSTRAIVGTSGRRPLRAVPFRERFAPHLPGLARAVSAPCPPLAALLPIEHIPNGRVHVRLGPQVPATPLSRPHP